MTSLRVLSIVLCVASLARSQATVDVPLRGYYRVGRYMPIFVSAPAAEEIRVEGDGLLPLRINAHGQPINGVYPMLVLRRPSGQVMVTADGSSQSCTLSLRECAEDERLIAVVEGATATEVDRIASGKRVVRINLTSDVLLDAAPMAWEILDGVVADERINQKVGPRTLRFQPMGPHTALDCGVDPATWNGRPGADPAVRRQAVGSAIIVAIMAIAASLLRSRQALLAVTGVTAISVASLAVWSAGQTGPRQVYGNIWAAGAGWMQVDCWIHYSSPRGGDVQLNAINLTWPMLRNAEQVVEQSIWLNADARLSTLTYSAKLGVDESLVFLQRIVSPASAETEKNLRATQKSPLHALARELYLNTAGCRIVGELQPQEANHFLGAVMVKRITP